MIHEEWIENCELLLLKSASFPQLVFVSPSGIQSYKLWLAYIYVWLLWEPCEVMVLGRSYNRVKDGEEGVAVAELIDVGG